MKPSSLQVVVEGPIRFGRIVTEGDADNQIDICGPNMWHRPFGEFPYEISGRKSSCEVDALTPRSHIA